MEALRIVQKMVWGPWLLGLFLAVGVLCMVRLRGFPIRHIRVWWGETVGSGGKGQLLTTCTALAATVGTGNITGVAAALAIGGPGAVFWMWAAAFLGMALAYTEVYLGILYGGGPYVYLENGAGSCFAGKCYALFCVLASLGMGCMVQAGALADSLRYAASLPPLGIGIILAVLTAVVLFGGAKRIGWTASVLVPVSAGLYLLAGGIAVFSFYDQIPEVLGKIVGGAFGLADNAGQTDGSSILNFSGISGGMTGYGMAAAIRSGVSRGVFSNEAGLGSLAVLHGSLAGLFALWASTQTDLFYGIAAASPSVWFPGWMEFEQQYPMQTQRVYLSLGDKEECTKNTVMAVVGNNIRTLHSQLTARGVDCTLKWNSGGHFKDAGLRTAKAFRWAMEESR